MIVGSDLCEFYVDAWRSTPALVAAMAGGDEGLIRTHAGIAKTAGSLERAVLEMVEGSILVAYQGFKAIRHGNGQLTSHQLAAFVRAVDPHDDANIPFANLMIDAVPLGADQITRYLVPHPDADPMDMPNFVRVSASGLNVDIWQLSFNVAENYA